MYEHLLMSFVGDVICFQVGLFFFCCWLAWSFLHAYFLFTEKCRCTNDIFAYFYLLCSCCNANVISVLILQMFMSFFE